MYIVHLIGMIVGKRNFNLVGKFSLYGQNIMTEVYGKSSLLELTDVIYKKSEDEILNTNHLVLRGPLA